MSVPKLSRALLLGAAALVLAACATTRPPVPPSPEAQRILEILETRWKQFEDLRGLVEVTVSRDRAVQRFDGVLLLKSPSAIRFEALSPFGQPFLFLILSGDGFTYYNVAENRALVGSRFADATDRWLGIALRAEELAALLAGQALPLPNAREVTLVSADAVGPSLLLKGESWSQRIWFHPDSVLPLQMEVTGGRAPLRVVLQRRGDATLPASVTLTLLDRPLLVSLLYRNVELRPGLSPSAFEFTLPASANVQRVN